MNYALEEIKRKLSEEKPDINAIRHKLDEVLQNGGGDMPGASNAIDFRKAYETLASSIPNTNVMVYDRDLVITSAYGREMEEFGYSREHFEGKNLVSIWSVEEREKLEKFYLQALEGRRMLKSFVLDNFHYKIQLIPIRTIEGNVGSVMSVNTNISDDWQKEHDLKTAKEDAESANRAKSEFMANMSHEIRTPLNSIIGFTEQFGKTALTEEQRGFLNLIEDSSEHLLSIVNEILILMKIGAGSLYIEKAPFSVEHIFNQAINAFRIRAQKKGIQFSSKIEKNTPEVLIGDPVRLKQILINLLSNAIKFTQFGYVKCSFNTLGIDEDKAVVEIKVKDSGIGIDKEEMDTIFAPFGQSDSSVTRKFGGSGLGLTIVKELVEIQDGSIKVSSNRNKGTTFVVRLPFGIGKQEDLSEEEHVFAFDTSMLEGLKVLLVDDDETNRLLAKTILNGWNIHFDEASNGKDALQLLSEKKYDLVLLDVHMPNISGLEVVRQVRDASDNPNNDTKFIAVTANIVRSDLKIYEKSGMNDHLIKPYREEAMFNKVCNVLNLSSAGGKDKRGGEGKTILESEKTDDKPYDLNELINVSKGDVNFYNKTLNSFIETAEITYNSLSKLKEKEDWDQIGEKAHKLISSLRFLGLSEIANICVQIEDATLKNSGGNVSRNVDLLLNRLENVLPQLKNEYISH